MDNKEELTQFCGFVLGVIGVTIAILFAHSPYIYLFAIGMLMLIIGLVLIYPIEDFVNFFRGYRVITLLFSLGIAILLFILMVTFLPNQEYFFTEIFLTLLAFTGFIIILGIRVAVSRLFFS